MRSRRIFHNALLLTAVNLLLRFAGTTFQVYLSGRIGAEGIGLLQLTLSLGSLAMVGGIAGIRTATMYLTAEELGKERPGNIIWVLSGCIAYSLLCSGAVALFLYIFAPQICQSWIGNVQIIPSVQLFAAFLPVNCLTGVMVGYFTGANRIRTLAAVEVAEQICSILTTVLILRFWAGHDAGRSILAVIMGSCAGSCLTLVCLLILRLRERSGSHPKIPIARRLTAAAIPLAIADDFKTGINTVENLMVPKRLALFPGTGSALAAFGTVSGMVFPVLMFPAAILFGLTELLIPELARCQAAGSNRRIQYLTRQSLRVSLLYGALCAGILFLVAKPLCLALYDSVEAGRYLQWFAPLAVMLYCDLLTDAMVKGLGQQKISVRFNILTSAMDVLLLYLLLPKLGIAGYFLSFFATHAINFILSIGLLRKLTGQTIPFSAAVLTLLCGVLSLWIAGHLSDPVFQSFAYAVLLLCSLYLCGVIGKEDFAWFGGLLYKK